MKEKITPSVQFSFPLTTCEVEHLFLFIDHLHFISNELAIYILSPFFLSYYCYVLKISSPGLSFFFVHSMPFHIEMFYLYYCNLSIFSLVHSGFNEQLKGCFLLCSPPLPQYKFASQFSPNYCLWDFSFTYLIWNWFSYTMKSSCQIITPYSLLIFFPSVN